MFKKKQPGPRLNLLNIPIYSLEVFERFVYIGGGGGYEIANKIICYEIEEGKKLLTKVVEETPTAN